MLANLVRQQSSLNWSSQLIVAGDRGKIKDVSYALDVRRLFSYLRDTATHYRVNIFGVNCIHIFFHGTNGRHCQETRLMKRLLYYLDLEMLVHHYIEESPLLHNIYST